MKDYLVMHFKAAIKRTSENLLKIRAIQLVYSTAVESGKHEIALMAAGVAYFCFLSIFPLIMGLIALLGFFLPSVDVQNALLDYVGDNIPGATSILKQNISSIIEMRGAMGILSLVILIWGASAMFGAVSRSINRAWEIGRYRPFFVRKASELGMVLGIGVLFLLSLGTSAVIPVIFNALKLPAADNILVNMGSRLVAFLLIFLVFLLLYKFIPFTGTSWRYTWPGALTASILFEAARTLFIYYLSNFANYQLIYGSIASIIALLVWIYYSSFIMIMGAEFTSQHNRLHRPATAVSGVEK